MDERIEGLYTDIMGLVIDNPLYSVLVDDIDVKDLGVAQYGVQGTLIKVDVGTLHVMVVVVDNSVTMTLTNNQDMTYFICSIDKVISMLDFILTEYFVKYYGMSITVS